jgi:hypothetical protein
MGTLSKVTTTRPWAVWVTRSRSLRRSRLRFARLAAVRQRCGERRKLLSHRGKGDSAGASIAPMSQMTKRNGGPSARAGQPSSRKGKRDEAITEIHQKTGPSLASLPPSAPRWGLGVWVRLPAVPQRGAAMRTAAIQQESSQAGAGTRAQRRALAVVATTHRRRPKPSARLPAVGLGDRPARRALRRSQRWWCPSRRRPRRARRDRLRCPVPNPGRNRRHRAPLRLRRRCRTAPRAARRLRPRQCDWHPECPGSRAGLPRNLTRVKVRQVVAKQIDC